MCMVGGWVDCIGVNKLLNKSPVYNMYRYSRPITVNRAHSFSFNQYPAQWEYGGVAWEYHTVQYIKLIKLSFFSFLVSIIQNSCI